MKRKKSKEEIKEFVDINYLTCAHCGYNNARQRLEFFHYCLNCGRPLGNRSLFKKELKKRMEIEKNGFNEN